MCSYLLGEDTKDVYICPRRNWTSTWKRFIMVYQLDKPKSKAQEILWTRNGHGMERRVKHTLFFWTLTRHLLTATAEGSWARWAFKPNKHSHSHIFKWGDMELLLLLQIGRDTLLSTKGKEISTPQVWMFMSVKRRQINIVHFPCVPTLKVCPCNTALLSRVNKHLKSL